MTCAEKEGGCSTGLQRTLPVAKDVRALLHARAAVCAEACMCVFDVDNRLVRGLGRRVLRC